MKILLIAPSVEPVTGWGTYAKNVYEGLLQSGHQVVILTAETGLPNPLSLTNSMFRRWQCAWLIARATAKYVPDVIHVLAEPYALAMPSASRLKKLPPWIMNFHGTYSVKPYYHKSTKGCMEMALSQCDAFLACSEFTLNEVKKALPKKLWTTVEGKTRPIRLAVNTIESRSTLENHVIFVGEIKPRKGVEELVRGFITFTEKYESGASLHLVGKYKEGPYVRKIRNCIAESGMEQRIHLHGKTDDATLSALYAKAGAFVMLSKKEGYDFEGYGLVFIEANSRGIPTISSKESGGAEAVRDGLTGYVVDHKNEEQIADRLDRILNQRTIDPKNCIDWAKLHSVKQQTETCLSAYMSVTSSE